MASLAETKLKGRDYAQEASEGLFDQIKNLRALIEELTRQAGRMSNHNLAQTRRAAYKTGYGADAVLRANPYAVAGAALALGVLMGVLLRR